MKEKVLLVDVDSKIPNLALMKLSTHYKKEGYEVELKKFDFSYYPDKKRITKEIDGSDYSKVFISIIFPINKDVVNIINCNEVVYGGTGYEITKKLTKEIEDSECDYTIYPENDISYGFITRGCIRNCSFCFVPKKEGMLHKVNTVDNIVRHKKVRFLDNNILAFYDHKEIFQELIDKKIKCSFNEGLDIRLINDENALLLSKLDYYPSDYIFAFDNVKLEKFIESKLKILKKYIIKDWKVKFFIYCHPDMEITEDVIYRINWCKRNKVLPYLMRDASCWGSDKRNFYIDLAAYCNQPSLFKKVEFKEFMVKRTNNKERQEESIRLFYNNSKVNQDA